MNSNSSDDNSLIHMFDLPNDIFSYVDDQFYSIIELIAGEALCNIIRIQLISSARKLLNTPDVFEFFQIESIEADALKAEYCFTLISGNYIVKPGIQTSLSS